MQSTPPFKPMPMMTPRQFIASQFLKLGIAGALALVMWDLGRLAIEHTIGPAGLGHEIILSARQRDDKMVQIYAGATHRAATVMEEATIHLRTIAAYFSGRMEGASVAPEVDDDLQPALTPVQPEQLLWGEVFVTQLE